MYGIDLFFTTAAAGVKIAQKNVENMFRLMELFLQQPSRSENETKVVSRDEETAKKEQPAPKSPEKPEGSTSISSVAQVSTGTGEMKPVEPVAKKAETKSPVPESNAEAGSEAVIEKTADSARKAPATREEAIPKRQTASPAKTKIAQPKKKTASDKAPVAAVDIVRRLLSERKTPLKTEEIVKATGFKKRKVQDSLYRLKKRGEIKMVEKGVYVKK